MAAFTALLISTLVSTGFSVGNSVRGGKAARRAGEAEQAADESAAQLYEQNAGTAEQQAADAVARGHEAEERYRELVAGTIGSQRASFAAGNIDINVGSARDVQADARHLGDLDIATIRKNASQEAFGFHAEADDLRQRAVIARKSGAAAAAGGRAAATQAYFGAAETALGTTASLLQAKYGFRGASSRPGSRSVANPALRGA